MRRTKAGGSNDNGMKGVIGERSWWIRDRQRIEFAPSGPVLSLRSVSLRQRRLAVQLVAI